MQNITTNVSRRTFLAGAGSAAVVAVLGLAGCGATGGSAGSAAESGEDLLTQIQDRGEMIFATEGTWSPWTFHDADGNLTGYDIEVARAIAAELGVEASFAEGEWDGLLAGLDSGRYDTMANGVSVTEQREEQYDFTEPYAYNRIVVITLNDSDITSLDDLEGKRTANTLGSSYATLAESCGATNTGVDDFNQTIELLQQGRIDATLNDEVVFYDYLRAHPDAPLKIAAENDEPTHVAFPLRKGSETETLREAMNEAITTLRENGTLSSLSNEFFGLDISEA
ncbi:transporter substrate-binding domain-containing protein [Collinsella intestinalis]|uniref:transporter substrate-binding domain-containing protein n=1 Tax=Collinsella intestinalis TaxID=147207 RepID=UPI00195EB7F1|nr:transporter substrate-binding domain-containing protein [Collinsella intestinalis]MBM6682871.1 transporter substrate-binding domain-containing protein [Collinsella intestinalis]